MELVFSEKKKVFQFAEKSHKFYKTRRFTESRRMGWARHVARMGDMTVAYMVLVGRPWGNTLLGIPRRIWENNINMNFQEVRWGH
jgi:hypothetical protein